MNAWILGLRKAISTRYIKHRVLGLPSAISGSRGIGRSRAGLLFRAKIDPPIRQPNELAELPLSLE
jgi:hypothetical protein